MCVPTNPELRQEQGYAYAAVSPSGGRNLFITGAPCTRCDDTIDPYYRTGKPCQWARAHAWNTIANWGRGRVRRYRIADLPADVLAALPADLVAAHTAEVPHA
jgi:hypothetical protein